MPIVTNNSALPLTTRSGIPTASTVNQAGDFAYIDSGQSLFLRRAGQPLIRVIQPGDAVPGLTLSRVQQVTSFRLNDNGMLVMHVDLGLLNGAAQGALLTYIGSSLTTVVTGLDTAPGTGGASFERGFALLALNNAGDILFTASLARQGTPDPVRTTLFVVPFGGSPVRLVGLGDALPGTPGVVTSFGSSHFNTNGEALVSAAFSTFNPGLYVTSAAAGTRKVVRFGDPAPGGGTIGVPTPGVAMNNDGEVAFNEDTGKLWIHRPATGLQLIATAGQAAPMPGGGTFSTFTVQAMTDSEAILSLTTVTGNVSSTGAMFRHVGGTVQLVAYRQQPAPDLAGEVFAVFSGATMNGSGTAAFCAQGAGPAFWMLGCYSQSGTDVPVGVALKGQATGLPGGGTYEFVGHGFYRPFILENGALALKAGVSGGEDDATEFVKAAGGAANTLFKTSDRVPEGGAVLLSRRSFGTYGSGNYVTFLAQTPGGGFSIGLHNLGTNTTSLIATEGQAIPGVVGRPRMDQITTAFVNGNGQVPFTALLWGGPFFRGGVLLASPGGIQPIVLDGDTDSAGRTLTFTGTNPSGHPPINDAGQVVFAARVNFASVANGVYVGSAGAAPVKVAMVGDLPNVGPAITGFPGTGVLRGITASGNVVFIATTSAGNGLFIGSPGGVPQKLVSVGDAAPGGGTFASLAMAGFNNNGQVVFQATLSGGAGGGVYQTSAGQPIVAIALNGAPAPSGGNFAITTARPEVQINDAGDVLFLSDLTGGGVASGYFIRRGPAGVLQTLVLQGDPAPGAPGVFYSLQHSLNNIYGEFMQLSQTGHVSFWGAIDNGGWIISGNWHAGPGNVISRLALWGTAQPIEFGGGVIIRTGPFSNWAGSNRFPVWARLSGGTLTNALMMYFAPISTAVPAGGNIVVTPMDGVTLGTPVTLTFTSITVPGVANLSVDAGGPPLPAGYVHAPQPRFYNVTTTATFTGPITVCINFSGTAFPPGSVIRLLHYAAGTWTDITTTGPTNNVICGSATSLSPFAVVRVLNAFGPELIQNGNFNSGLTNWLLFAQPNQTYISAQVVAGVLEFYRVPPPPNEPTQAVVFQQTGVPLQPFTPLVLTFNAGNSSSVRKRLSVLIHDQNFLDLHVCTMWLPPNMPISPFTIRSHTTQAWVGATVSFYAASAGSDGGAYLLDNVSLRANADVSAERTDCVDPNAPAAPGGPPSASLLGNGDFSTGLLLPWGTFGAITWQIAGGVFEFIRATGAPAGGVVLQKTLQPAATGEILTATLDLGNSSAVRKRVTILVHDNSFLDLAACTFWLPPGQPLSTYTVRSYTTMPWTDTTLSVYVATEGNQQWIRFDNASLQRTPGIVTFGTDCVEPAPVPPAPPPPGLGRSAGGLK